MQTPNFDTPFIDTFLTFVSWGCPDDRLTVDGEVARMISVIKATGWDEFFRSEVIFVNDLPQSKDRLTASGWLFAVMFNDPPPLPWNFADEFHYQRHNCPAPASFVILQRLMNEYKDTGAIPAPSPFDSAILGLNAAERGVREGKFTAELGWAIAHLYMLALAYVEAAEKTRPAA